MGGFFRETDDKVREIAERWMVYVECLAKIHRRLAWLQI
jgi:hypothetical protein